MQARYFFMNASHSGTPKSPAATESEAPGAEAPADDAAASPAAAAGFFSPPHATANRHEHTITIDALDIKPPIFMSLRAFRPCAARAHGFDSDLESGQDWTSDWAGRKHLCH